jgi:hypothetical protein
MTTTPRNRDRLLACDRHGCPPPLVWREITETTTEK